MVRFLMFAIIHQGKSNVLKVSLGMCQTALIDSFLTIFNAPWNEPLKFSVSKLETHILAETATSERNKWSCGGKLRRYSIWSMHQWIMC